MEITKRDGNIIEVYELNYDKEKVKELMQKILDNCCFKYSGKQEELVKAMFAKFVYKIIDNIYAGSIYTNDIKKYENIDFNSIKIEDNYYSDWEHGDPYKATFNATRVEAPMLYHHLANILDENEKGYLAFLEYPNSIELEPFSEREYKLVKRLRYLVNGYNDIENNIETIEEIIKRIKTVQKEKNDNKDYDFKLLASYYEEALNLFSLKLKRKTVIYEEAEPITFKKK